MGAAVPATSAVATVLTGLEPAAGAATTALPTIAADIVAGSAGMGSAAALPAVGPATCSTCSVWMGPTRADNATNAATAISTAATEWGATANAATTGPGAVYASTPRAAISAATAAGMGAASAAAANSTGLALASPCHCSASDLPEKSIQPSINWMLFW